MCLVSSYLCNLPGIEFIPQSMTTAPGLTHDPFTISGTPMPTEETKNNLAVF